MAKKKVETIYSDVVVNGKKYKYRRVVTGTRRRTQVIFVDDIPEDGIINPEHDKAEYGKNHHNPSIMPSIAETIAASIIRKYLRAKNDNTNGP